MSMHWIKMEETRKGRDDGATPGPAGIKTYSKGQVYEVGDTLHTAWVETLKIAKNASAAEIKKASGGSKNKAGSGGQENKSGGGS